MTFSTRKLATSCYVLALSGMMSMPALAEQLFTVTTTADSGEGSLRAALMQAAAGADAARIVLTAKGTIALQSTLDYAGTAPLTIIGTGQEIALVTNATILKIGKGADLDLSGVTLKGPGGFSIEARGDQQGPAGKGIFVDVAEDATGTVALRLRDVTIEGVAGHGVHVSDCTLADECGAGGGGAGEGSAAGIDIYLDNVTIRDLGHGSFDSDGLRVDERGPGDIRFTAVNSRFVNVGADGVELDEGQAGDVIAEVTDAQFDRNGAYCNPALLKPFLPAEVEAEFEQGTTQEAAVPGPVTGAPDDRCIEREVKTYDDGSVKSYEFGIDTDDGFDIDEAGAGSVRAALSGLSVSGNLDEGLDFDEEDAGDIVLTLANMDGRDNSDDAVKLSEEGDGGVFGSVVAAKLEDNGGKGAVFEEEDAGDLAVAMIGGMTAGNDDGDTGVEAVQDHEGTGKLIVSGTEIGEKIEAEGVDLTRH